MVVRKSLLCLSLVLLLVRAAGAQMPGMPVPGRMPEMFGEFKMPGVGSYAEYKLTYSAQKMEMIARMSIVGKEKTSEGKELYWYEYQTTDPKTGGVEIAKMLVSGNPQEEGTISRMIFKHNQDKAIELPPEMMQMINAPMKSEGKKVKEEGEIKKLGKETLKTQAGNLDCTHLQYISDKKEITDVWQSGAVPFFGLAKSVTRGMTMEIQKFGKDAKSGITEEPEKIVIPGMKKEEMPGLDTLKKKAPGTEESPE